MTNTLRAKREEKAKLLGEDRAVLKSVRESEWTWNRIQPLLQAREWQLSDLALETGIGVDTVRKALYRHRNEVTRPRKGVYGLTGTSTGTFRPLVVVGSCVDFNFLKTSKGEGVPVSVPVGEEESPVAGGESFETRSVSNSVSEPSVVFLKSMDQEPHTSSLKSSGGGMEGLEDTQPAPQKQRCENDLEEEYTLTETGELCRKRVYQPKPSNSSRPIFDEKTLTRMRAAGGKPN